MKEEWLFSGAMVPVDAATTAALVAEIKRLINVVGGMALSVNEWVGLTDDEIEHLRNDQPWWMVRDIEAKLKEKNT